MRTVVSQAIILILVLCLALEAQAAPRKKRKKGGEVIDVPPGDVIEEVVNEGGTLKTLEVISPPDAEAYALLFLKGDEEVAVKEEGPLEFRKTPLTAAEKSVLEGIVGLVSGMALGWVGGAATVHSVKGNRDLAFATSLGGVGAGSAAAAIPTVYAVGNFLLDDRGSALGTALGGLAGAILGAAVTYPTRDFSASTFIIPVLTAAGSVLGYRYLFPPPPPPPAPESPAPPAPSGSGTGSGDPPRDHALSLNTGPVHP